MKISEAFDLYIDESLFMRGLSRGRIQNCQYHRNSAVFFMGNKEISKVTLGDIHNWEKELLKGRCWNTVREYITSLRCVLEYCRVKGVKCLDSTMVPVPKRVIKEMPYATPEDTARMIEATSSLRTKFVVSFLYASGVRVSEFCSLNRDQINHDSFSVIGKGNKRRTCFIDARARRYMEAYLASREDNDPALLVGGRVTIGRVTPSTVQEIVRRARKRAGITKPITPHSFRHGLATNLIKNGAVIPAVQKIMGHANLNTTMIYTHIEDPALQEIYNKKHSC